MIRPCQSRLGEHKMLAARLSQLEARIEMRGESEAEEGEEEEVAEYSEEEPSQS